MFLVLIPVRGYAGGRILSIKTPMTSSGIEPANFRLVVPQPFRHRAAIYIYIYIYIYICVCVCVCINTYRYVFTLFIGHEGPYGDFIGLRHSKCRWGVSPTPRPSLPREIPCTHCTGGWVGPRAGTNGRKILSPPGFDPRPPARSQSLYRLNYPAKHIYI